MITIKRQNAKICIWICHRIIHNNNDYDNDNVDNNNENISKNDNDDNGIS